MRWVRPGEQLVNQSGALVFFNINLTQRGTVQRGAGTARSGQEQQQKSRYCCRQPSCPVGFGVTTWRWYPYATHLLGPLQVPATWVLLMGHGADQTSSSFIIHMERGEGLSLAFLFGIFKLQLKRNKTMRNIDIKYQSNLLKKRNYFISFPLFEFQIQIGIV